METFMLFVLVGSALMLGVVLCLNLVQAARFFYRCWFYRHRIEVPFSMSASGSVKQWVEDKQIACWQSDPCVMRFHRVEDAVHFKLRWL